MSATHALKRAAPRDVNVIAAGTADTDLGVTHTWITVCAYGGALHLKFGSDGLSAADTSDWPLAENEKESFWIGGEDGNRVSIIGTSAAIHERGGGRDTVASLADRIERIEIHLGIRIDPVGAE